ncbi:hypothetical protein AcV7_003306 [Taiwanofungus camphoratus]|nr:hypothetical protein AcV7_003306 [Antrodia cinnamomea]
MASYTATSTIGVELVLYFMTMYTLLKNKASLTRSDKFFMIFSSVLLCLITIYLSTEAVFGQEMWIIHADYPGGAAAYLDAKASVWYQTMGTAASVALNLLNDALMIYRCYLVWDNGYVIIIPCFLYVATLGLGVTELYFSGAPSANFFAGLAAKLSIAYFATTIGLNTLLTCLISARILLIARRVRRELDHRLSRTYISVASIVIEAAIPYALFGIAFLVTQGIGSGISVLFLSFYQMLTCISPQMIVFRVVSGRSWTQERHPSTTPAIELPSRSRYLPSDHADISDINTVNLSLGSMVKSDISFDHKI